MFGRWGLYVLLIGLCMFDRSALYPWSIGFVCLVDGVCMLGR